MEKAIAYLFGNKIIGTVKLTDVGDCVYFEIDIKNILFSEVELVLGNSLIIDFSYLPLVHRGRIRLCFYSDMLPFRDMIGKKISIKSLRGEKLAEGNIIKVYPGKRFYTEVN